MQHGSDIIIDNEILRKKLLAIYPDLDQRGIDGTLFYSKEQNARLIQLERI